MQGKIMKGIAGFYYVYTKQGLVECKARGIFRKEQIKPLVGDLVEVEITEDTEAAPEMPAGNIVEILPRSNELVRPAVANVDQALVIFAIVKPDPNYNLLDRFLINVKRQSLPCVICFNKKDLASEQERGELLAAYEGCGCRVIFVSGIAGEGFSELAECLEGKTTVLAGPSGVGKSTIVNRLYPQANMETGEISAKIERGMHTTRHSELIAIGEGSYILDTPGFSSLGLFDLEKERLAGFYPEFAAHERYCRFGGCAHIGEKDCGVKSAVEEGAVSRMRYENYRLLYEELKGMERKKVKRL